MTPETKECNGVCEGSTVEFEGKGVVELDSEGDLKKLGDCNGIACREGEENDGDATDGSFVLVNGDSDDHSEKDLDLDEKVDPDGDVVAEPTVGAQLNAVHAVEEGMVVKDEGASEEKGENRELSFELDHDHEVRLVSNLNSDIVEEDCKESIALSDVMEQTETDRYAGAEENGESPKEKLGNEEFSEQEENGEFCEENGKNLELCEEQGRYVEQSKDNAELCQTGKNGELSEENSELCQKEKIGELCIEKGENGELGEENSELCQKEEIGELCIEKGENAEMSEEIEQIADSCKANGENAELFEGSGENAELCKENGAHSEMHEENAELCKENGEDAELCKENAEYPELCEENVKMCKENTEFFQEKAESAELCEETGGDDELCHKEENGELCLENGQDHLESKGSEATAVDLMPNDQEESESAFEVEEQEPEIVVTKTVGSESLPLENKEEIGMPNVADDVPTDECSGDLGIVPEVKCETAGVGNKSPESGEAHPTCHIDDVDSKAEIIGDPLEDSETMTACSIENMQVESEVNKESTGSGDAVPTDDDMESETKVDICIEVPCCPVNDMDLQSEVISGFVESGETKSASPNNDMELENEVCNDTGETERDVSTEHVTDVKLESEVENDSVESGKFVASSVEGDSSLNKDVGEEFTREETEAIDRSHQNGLLQSPPEDPRDLSLDGEKVGILAIKPQPCYLIRVPRFTNEMLWTEIQHADLGVRERTRSRDVVRVAKQKQKAICSEYREKFEAAKTEERAARDAVSAKRQEIDSIQSTINKMKNATSIDEINDKIHNIEHMMQHETMPLKQEKQLIREITQLKHLREQHSSNMGPEAELQEAFDQRDQIEERFRILRKELDSLRTEVLRTEGDARAARKQYDDECQRLRELNAQFEDADGLRQEAYGHLWNLKKESFEKSKYFHLYKNDQNAAMTYASSGDREGLQCHCSNQIERIMELWNTNDEFRNQYVKANTMSTLRRFKTLDGRSLGVDEEPPVLRSNFDRNSSNGPSSFSNINTPLPILTLERKEENLVGIAAPMKMDALPATEMAQTNQSAKSKKSTKPTSRETVMPTVSNRVEVKAVEAEKENKRTEEEEALMRKEEELARKEEEFRKEKAAAELKEQCRLEQKAKAKEAEERKRRKAEKVQAKAELRAQREAELREKKKAKKEKKKGATADTTDEGIEVDGAPLSESSPPEIAQELETTGTSASRRSSRPQSAMKQYNKIKPLPLPLRNRGKRKMQTWMWVLLTTLLVLALFLAGNYVSPSKFSLPNFGF